MSASLARGALSLPSRSPLALPRSPICADLLAARLVIERPLAPLVLEVCTRERDELLLVKRERRQLTRPLGARLHALFTLDSATCVLHRLERPLFGARLHRNRRALARWALLSRRW